MHEKPQQQEQQSLANRQYQGDILDEVEDARDYSRLVCILTIHLRKIW